VFIVDSSESELGTLDLITTFVEVLDASFENVCELDIIFHSDKVHYIIEEIVQGGLVLETNKDDIMGSIKELHKEDQNSSQNTVTKDGITKIGQRFIQQQLSQKKNF